MNNIDYEHKIPLSFEAKLIQAIMSLFGMKKKMEKKMIASSFAKNPAKIPNSLLKTFNIIEIEQNGSGYAYYRYFYAIFWRDSNGPPDQKNLSQDKNIDYEYA